MKAKPILVVEVPVQYTAQDCDRTRNQINEKIKDYHVFVVNNGGDQIKFNVFYEKDFNEVTYEELKTFITNMLTVEEAKIVGDELSVFTKSGSITKESIRDLYEEDCRIKRDHPIYDIWLERQLIKMYEVFESYREATSKVTHCNGTGECGCNCGNHE